MQRVKANTVPLVSILSEDASLWLSHVITGTEKGVAMHTVSFLREAFSTHMKFPSDIDKDYSHKLYAEDKQNWVLLEAPTLANHD